MLIGTDPVGVGVGTGAVVGFAVGALVGALVGAADGVGTGAAVGVGTGLLFARALAAATLPAAPAPAATAEVVAAEAPVVAAEPATPAVAAPTPLEALVLTPELEKPFSTELVSALVATAPVADTVTTWPVNTVNVWVPTLKVMLSAPQAKHATVVFPAANVK
jgi:hypothetical protein